MREDAELQRQGIEIQISLTALRENRNALRDLVHGSQGGKSLVPGLDFERLHKFERESCFRRERDIAVTRKARAGDTRGRTD